MHLGLSKVAFIEGVLTTGVAFIKGWLFSSVVYFTNGLLFSTSDIIILLMAAVDHIFFTNGACTSENLEI